MSHEPTTPVIDMIRWTFTVQPEHRDAIERHLLDLGLDVHARGEGQFVVMWEEPDGEEDLDGVIEELWEIHGGPFEVTHEEFHRLNLMAYQPEDETAEDETADADDQAAA